MSKFIHQPEYLLTKINIPAFYQMNIKDLR